LLYSTLQLLITRLFSLDCIYNKWMLILDGLSAFDLIHLMMKAKSMTAPGQFYDWMFYHTSSFPVVETVTGQQHHSIVSVLENMETRKYLRSWICSVLCLHTRKLPVSITLLFLITSYYCYCLIIVIITAAILCNILLRLFTQKDSAPTREQTQPNYEL